MKSVVRMAEEMGLKSGDERTKKIKDLGDHVTLHLGDLAGNRLSKNI